MSWYEFSTAGFAKMLPAFSWVSDFEEIAAWFLPRSAESGSRTPKELATKEKLKALL
jgi:hypothetical protein